MPGPPTGADVGEDVDVAGTGDDVDKVLGADGDGDAVAVAAADAEAVGAFAMPLKTLAQAIVILSVGSIIITTSAYVVGKLSGIRTSITNIKSSPASFGQTRKLQIPTKKGVAINVGSLEVKNPNPIVEPVVISTAGVPATVKVLFNPIITGSGLSVTLRNGGLLTGHATKVVALL